MSEQLASSRPLVETWAAGPDRSRRLFRKRDFVLIFASTGLSSLGDYLALLALTIRVHDLTGSGWAIAGLLLTGLVPLVAFAPIAGLLVDRVETVRVLTLAALLQAGVAGGLAFAESLPLILGLSFLLGIGFAVTQPALFALVPRVTGEDRVTAGNAFLEAARWGGATLGPVAAGGLAAGFGTREALLVDAATFLLVAGAALALRVRRPPEQVEPDERERGMAREGMRVLSRDRVLRLVIVVLAAMVAFAAVDNVAEVFFAKDVLEAGDAGYGFLVAAWTLGIVLGTTLLARRITEPRLAGAVLLASVVGGAAVAVAGGFPVLPLALAMFLVGGGANGVESVGMRSLIHHRVPDRLRGRAFSAFFAIVTTAQIAAMGLGGALVAWAGARGSLLVAGLGGAGVGLVGLILYARLRDREDIIRLPETPAVGPEEEPAKRARVIDEEVSAHWYQ